MHRCAGIALVLLAAAGPARAQMHQRDDVPAPFPTEQPALAAFDTWVALPPPAARTGHTALFDPVDGAMIVFGGNDGFARFDDLWVLKPGPPSGWHYLPVTGPAPSSRQGAVAVLDPLRRRMLLFGGYDGTYLDDLWALDFHAGTWTRLDAGTGAGRAYPVVVHDPHRDALLVHGGFDGAPLGTMLVIRLDTDPPLRSVVPVPGDAPPPRFQHAGVFDADQDRLVIFGGFGEASLGDTWQYKVGGGWSAIEGAGSPAPRHSHAAVHDPVRHRMLVFGGYSGGYVDQTWSLDLASGTWELLAIGTPPPGRVGASAVLDPRNDRLLLFGGFSDSRQFMNDVWSLALVGANPWIRLAPSGSPVNRGEHGAAFDTRRGRLVVFGGNAGSGDTRPFRPGTFIELGDAWVLGTGEGAAWTAVNPLPAPRRRRGHTAIYDPVRDRLVVFGGWDGVTLLNDVWVLALTGTPAWTRLTPTGTAPERRTEHAAIYDPVRDRMVIHGGYDYFNGYLGDTWSMNLSGAPVWTRINATGSSGGRCQHAALYDAARDRMVIYGGDPGFTYTNRVDALALAGPPAWTNLSTNHWEDGPMPTWAPVAGIDPARDRLVVTGGWQEPHYADEVWEMPLAGGAWRRVIPLGTPPSARSQAAAVFDPAGRRMIVHGGRIDDVKLADTWALAFGDQSVYAAPGPRDGAPVPPRPPRHDDVEPLRSTRAGEGPALLPSPNPARQAVTLEFRLAHSGRVRLRVLDVAGRTVRVVEDGAREAGVHLPAWDLRDAHGQRVRPGLYVVQLEHDAGRVTARLAVLD
jgi:Galactose oxidase, central domain/FlgD Ig-like domain